ncbi:MAG TPA: hypothetical protein VFB99_22605 [Vicinamibacterales bacterium]|nr:hypothetical protein [Vicinamibacterales bacterium]HZM33876.1 hypothetical protein [Burkholderiales bacterium]
MIQRLITLRKIRQEKIERCRSWFGKERTNPSTTAGPFPAPIDAGKGGADLYDESEVDAWLELYVKALKERVASGERDAQVKFRTERAHRLVAARRTKQRAARKQASPRKARAEARALE